MEDQPSSIIVPIRKMTSQERANAWEFTIDITRQPRKNDLKGGFYSIRWLRGNEGIPAHGQQFKDPDTNGLIYFLMGIRDAIQICPRENPLVLTIKEKKLFTFLTSGFQNKASIKGYNDSILYPFIKHIRTMIVTRPALTEARRKGKKNYYSFVSSIVTQYERYDMTETDLPRLTSENLRRLNEQNPPDPSDTLHSVSWSTRAIPEPSHQQRQVNKRAPLKNTPKSQPQKIQNVATSSGTSAPAFPSYSLRNPIYMPTVPFIPIISQQPQTTGIPSSFILPPASQQHLQPELQNIASSSRTDTPSNPSQPHGGVPNIQLDSFSLFDFQQPQATGTPSSFILPPAPQQQLQPEIQNIASSSRTDTPAIRSQPHGDPSNIQPAPYSSFGFQRPRETMLSPPSPLPSPQQQHQRTIPNTSSSTITIAQAISSRPHEPSTSYIPTLPYSPSTLQQPQVTESSSFILPPTQQQLQSQISENIASSSPEIQTRLRRSARLQEKMKNLTLESNDFIPLDVDEPKILQRREKKMRHRLLKMTRNLTEKNEQQHHHRQESNKRRRLSLDFDAVDMTIAYDDIRMSINRRYRNSVDEIVHWIDGLPEDDPLKKRKLDRAIRGFAHETQDEEEGEDQDVFIDALEE
ncbi:hypothetical protein BDA99DRAFT_524799 [Phascolomyces articulosus]|uniref:Uncharacterized protein n=1 Tax=Phascolomyces articulosus TaxID=60185 RepID=A0AAD5JPF4_9FUNG|nr:hypothetical protein BDA99DRAFT_524799 [Phascolomyces articulosus]